MDYKITFILGLYGLDCIFAGFFAGTQNWYVLVPFVITSIVLFYLLIKETE